MNDFNAAAKSDLEIKSTENRPIHHTSDGHHFIKDLLLTTPFDLKARIHSSFTSAANGAATIDRPFVSKSSSIGSSQLVAIGNIPVVIKSFHLDRIPETKDSMADFIARLRHPHIVPIVSVALPASPSEPCMIAEEYIPSGSLLHLLQNRPQKLSYRCRLKILRDVACALQHIHVPQQIDETPKLSLIHGFLNSGNILIRFPTDEVGDEHKEAISETKDPHALLSHSILSSILSLTTSDGVVSQRIKGTIGYICPYYVATGYIDHRADLYSLGVLIYEIITRKPRIPHYILDYRRGQSVRAEDIDHSCGPWQPMILRDLIQLAELLVNPRPEQRPKIDLVVTCFESLLNAMKHDIPPMKSSAASMIVSAGDSFSTQTPRQHSSSGADTTSYSAYDQIDEGLFASASHDTRRSASTNLSGIRTSGSAFFRALLKVTPDPSSVAQGNRDGDHPQTRQTESPNDSTRASESPPDEPQKDSTNALVDDSSLNFSLGQKVEEAKSFLKKVKQSFTSHPETYFEFLEAMKQFKRKSLTLSELGLKVDMLFRNAPELHSEFTAFLKDAMDEPMQVQKESLTPQDGDEGDDEQDDGEDETGEGCVGLQSSSSGTRSEDFREAVRYVHMVKQRFSDEPQVYTSFFSALVSHKRGELDYSELQGQVQILFEAHSDLLSQFSRFLPCEGETDPFDDI
eukprot:TRINITY_DN3811_c0_g4_i1.p1 TRINITY_DN3811_c0_g4~~TRINITY_DN3811_c0_g4_i1.p1  ORF type:complete len:686 (-),score=139.94 TRINITY_DN3811_c0_g4_i1:551-2608(-)